MFNKNKMIKKIMFLLHHKKKASNHRFSKQLKNLQSNLLIGGFISIIYSSFAPHALKGQKLLAQGNALGNYGRKPVAL
jgi:hypothetical protein